MLEAIHRLKYQRRLIYAKFLSQLLASASAAALVEAADLLVPVPLHPRACAGAALIRPFYWPGLY
jgi:predicted amidophosphoribosyltransferase